MLAEEFLELIRRRPFIPIRVHMSDGSHYDIKHPEMVIVGRNTMVIALGASYEEGIPEDYAHCSWLHVTHVEDIKRPQRLSKLGKRKRAG